MACGYLVSCGIGVSRLAVYADTLLQRAAADEEAVPPAIPGRWLPRSLSASNVWWTAPVPETWVEPTLAALAGTVPARPASRTRPPRPWPAP
ncbi:hypothetical protein LT493_24110 [Streptomyces tricolor]|nr:hypothetical protein [Streptomyces tricolor]